jgi:PQQ-dependent catabolism-associated CXXCW motif protein
MKTAGLRSIVAGGIALLMTAATPDAPPEPLGYRMDDYRSPTPATLHGATVLSTNEARDLWERHAAVFIDVLPQAPRPTGLPSSTIWRDKPREDIPGSIWLPDTGYGTLAPVMEQYFAQGLEEVSGSDRDRILIFYCLVNCWMSWNAAKRAIAMGYTHVAWYPDGTDGWAGSHLPLELRPPPKRPQAAE